MSEVKPFRPLLAGQVDQLKQKFPCLVSPKYDGMRAIVRGGQLMSRKMEPIRNMWLQQVYGGLFFEDLDGELILGDPCAKDVFKRIQSLQSSPAKEPDGPVTFWVFDRVGDEPYKERLKDVARRAKVGKIDGIKAVPQLMVHNWAELEAAEEEFLRMGFEGVMVRSPDGEYKQGRSTTNEGILLKLKRFEHCEAEIFGWFEQMHNTNEATVSAIGATKRSTAKAGKVGKDTLGGFHCKVINGPFKGRAVDVGTGWTDKERAEIWECLGEITKKALEKAPGNLGTVVMKKFMEEYGLLRIKYQPVGSDDKPRFPVFDGWRSRSDV